MLALSLCACATAGAGRCFLGSSDPTLKAADAWEAAAAAAMSEAARAVLGVRVRACERVTADEADGVAIQETRGRLAGVAVVGWWRDPGGRGATPGTIRAVACGVGAAGEAAGEAAVNEAARLLPGAFRGPGLPEWLRRPAPGCAIGLSGPTLAPSEAVDAARWDARRRLALAIEAVVDDTVVDHRGVTWEFPAWRPGPGAQVEAGGVTGDEPAWVDAEGRGPLRTAGLAYARACVARAVQEVGDGSRVGPGKASQGGTP